MQPNHRQLSDLFDGLRLTPVQRRIAAHIVEQGSQAAFSSSIELAEQVGVSQPSVTRLATALGYGGFSELQREIQATVLAQQTARAQSATPSGENKMQRSVRHAIEGLQRLHEQLAELAAVEQAGWALARTPVLPVYGSRSAAAQAAQFEFFAAKIHPNVRLLTGARSELLDQLAQTSDLGASAMMVVALPRYPQELLDVLRSASNVGIAIVLLTDSVLSPASDLADHVLAAPVGSDLVFDAAVAPLQLMTVLLEALADASPARTRARLERFETLASEQRYFIER
jgi:DNA-binding MurR/RpiR family transcriptional regulator